MPAIDPVILQLRIDAQRAQAELRQHTRFVDSQFDAQERALGDLERRYARSASQIQGSLGSVRSSLLASAGLIAGAFGADKIVELADGYTAFTNQLKVAGLEGQNLAKTQDQLFGIAQKNGTQLGSLGVLYGRASAAAKDLGASNADIIKFTSGVSAALRIQGGSAEEASGALQQLGQLLGSARVQAEEFNSVADGARPILQAVANNIDGAGGSISKLKALVNDGKVSNVDFFQAFLKGSGQLEAQAAKASLTIGASFTILNNALGKYIGQTDKALSATDRISGGVKLLADNLDTVVPALATIGAVFASRGIAGSQALASLTAASALYVKALDSERVVILGSATAEAQRAQAGAASAATRVQEAELRLTALRGEQVAVGEIATQEKALAAERVSASAAAVTEAQARVAALREEQAQLAATSALINKQRADALQAQAAIRANNAVGFGSLGVTRSRPDAERANQDLKSQLVVKRALASTNAQLAAAETELSTAQARTAATTRASGFAAQLRISEALTAQRLQQASAEQALAVAQAESTAATNAATAATARLTLAARAGAIAARLFSGALALIGGPVGAAILGFAALVAAVIHFRTTATSATDDMKSLGDAASTINNELRSMNASAAGAAGGIAAAGNAAATSAGKMAVFAGQVGEAAAKLRELAIARRNDSVQSLQKAKDDANQAAAQAQLRIDQRRERFGGSNPRFAVPYTPDEIRRENRDQSIIFNARRIGNAADRAIGLARARPLESRVRDSDVTGRDVEGDLARVTRDLVVARRRGIRASIESLEAQKFELTQYKKYRKDGLTPQASQEAASKDAADFRNASAGAQGDRDAKTARTARSKADREAAAAARKQAAAVRDDAADTRAYKAAERQANNDIASARAELSGSLDERLKIEKDRVEADRQSRNDELDEQAKQGRFGEGDVQKRRVLELKNLNDQRAAVETQLADARSRAQADRDALDLTLGEITSQRDLLQERSQMVETLGERRSVELALLQLQRDEEEARLRAVLAINSLASDAEKKAAQQRLDALPQIFDARRAGVIRGTEGPGAAYLRQVNAVGADINTAIDGAAADGLDRLNDGLAQAISGAKSLGDVFDDVSQQIIQSLLRIAIQQTVIKPIAETLFGKGSSGIGGNGSGIGGLAKSVLSLFGRASGGFVSAGDMVRVNEGASPGRVEGFRPTGSGHVIPLGQMASRPGAVVQQPVVIQLSADEGSMFVPRIRQISGGTAVQVVQAAAPSIASASAAKTQTDMRRADTLKN